MRKKARGGSWQGRAGSEGSSWVDAGRPPLSRQERDPGGAGPGKSRNGGRKARGDGGGGDPVPGPGRRIFSGPFAPPRSQAKLPPPSSLFLGRASVLPDAESVARRGEERGIGASVQSVAGSESGRSRSLLRLVGPLPAQDLFGAGRPPVATTLDRPSLRSCPRLFVWSPPPGIGPGLLILSPRRREGLGRPGTGPEGARRGRKKRRARQSFLFPRPLSLLSLQTPPRESCFLPAVSAVILSKNPVQ